MSDPLRRLLGPFAWERPLRPLGRMRPLGHPLHPVLADFPVALLAGAAWWDLWSLAAPEAAVGLLAALHLGLGALSGLGAALSGLIDYATTVPGSTRRREVVKHGLWTSAALLAAPLSLAARWPLRPAEPTPLLAVLFSLAAAVLVLVGSSRGQRLVYRLGMRVRAG